VVYKLFNQPYPNNKISDAESDPLKIVCGVPQGSILGTTLFLIYVNGMSKSLKYLTPYLYADDINLFIESKDLNNIMPRINEDLLSFYKWCVADKLTINISKTNYIVLKNPQNKISLQTNKILLNNIFITQANTVVNFANSLLCGLFMLIYHARLK